MAWTVEWNGTKIEIGISSAVHQVETDGLTDSEISDRLMDLTGEEFTYENGAVRQP